MQKTPSTLIEECQLLRKQGYSLDEIVRTTGVPRTTVYGHIVHIPLSPEKQSAIRIATTKRINEFNITVRKGKALPGRVFEKPDSWSPEFVFAVSHFMFDGEILYGGCAYYNRSDYLIETMRSVIKRLFGLDSRVDERDDGVKRIGYYNVEFGQYAKQKSVELLSYIQMAPVEEKRVFLRSFFDDEGSVGIYKNSRKVKGYQHNLIRLSLVQKLLKDFYIDSRVDEKYQEIVISRKENLIKFRKEINFSKGVYINPKRTNSIWKKKLEKRQLLDIAINSFQG
ncbi:MAG TPA: LAGLIDADG family homing endonuclease [Candidatus Paceibacterota bacterium]